MGKELQDILAQIKNAGMPFLAERMEEFLNELQSVKQAQEEEREGR